MQVNILPLQKAQSIIQPSSVSDCWGRLSRMLAEGYGIRIFRGEGSTFISGLVCWSSWLQRHECDLHGYRGMSSDTVGSEAPFPGLKTKSQMTNHWQQCFLAHKNTPGKAGQAGTHFLYCALPCQLWRLRAQRRQITTLGAWWGSLKQHMNLCSDAHQKSLWSEVSSPTTGNCDQKSLSGSSATHLYKVCALHIANPWELWNNHCLREG